jgi:hypothetical protein
VRTRKKAEKNRTKMFIIVKQDVTDTSHYDISMAASGIVRLHDDHMRVYESL